MKSKLPGPAWRWLAKKSAAQCPDSSGFDILPALNDRDSYVGIRQAYAGAGLWADEPPARAIVVSPEALVAALRLGTRCPRVPRYDGRSEIRALAGGVASQQDHGRVVVGVISVATGSPGEAGSPMCRVCARCCGDGSLMRRSMPPLRLPQMPFTTGWTGTKGPSAAAETDAWHVYASTAPPPRRGGCGGRSTALPLLLGEGVGQVAPTTPTT